MRRLATMLGLLLAALTVVASSSGQAAAQTDVATKARQILDRFAHEPDVLEVQRAAAYHNRVDPEAYESWLTQANAAFVLPDQLKGRVYLRDYKGNDVRSVTGTGSRTDLVWNEARVWYQFDVRWNLSKIIFNDDRLDIVKQIARIADQREDILTTVNKLYFARREIQVNVLLNPPTDVAKAVRTQLRIDALTADLDALTGGWFSQALRSGLPKGATEGAAAPAVPARVDVAADGE